MAEILGIGTTHYPPLASTDEAMSKAWQFLIKAPRIDAKWKDPANWPSDMVAEIGDDEGLGAARAHRERLWENFRKQRDAIDEFKPDFIVLIADDQYENFKEDIIPPFCVYGLDDTLEQEVWNHGVISRGPNFWGEPQDFRLKLHGHREGAKFLTSGLLELGVAMPYAYKLLHAPVLSHGFNCTMLYLDVDRQGFEHPIVPFHVNCYGSSVITSHGGADHLFKEPETNGLPDPPSPSPALCHEVGAKIAETLRKSPYRCVIMASSGWSHGFLSPNTGYFAPDTASDRMMLTALSEGNHSVWQQRTTNELEGAGHHEMLNWHVLIGAMSHLGQKPMIADFIETHIFQSNKCFATFPPA